MNIGEVSQQVGLPAKTIRYYEEIGLIQPQREANGYRRYGAVECRQLVLLRRARQLGFSIEDCQRLLSLYHDPKRSSADVKSLVHEHLRLVDEKMSELNILRDELERLEQTCHGGDQSDCPILERLTAE